MNKIFFISLIIISIKGYTSSYNLKEMLSSDIFYLSSSDKLILTTDGYSMLYLIKPVKANYSNITDANKIKLQEIKYTSEFLVKNKNRQYILKLESGVYYISTDEFPIEFTTDELLHLSKNTTQIVVRDGDDLYGYLSELSNTPFINTPLRNSNGLNQVENRVGSDCASFVTYGLRRMGKKIPYTNPIDFVSFLQPVNDYWYYPQKTNTDLYVYKNEYGLEYKISSKHDTELILSFNDHIAVLYEDKGIPGILDSDDLVIQSWFDGPGIVRLKDNGFFGYPIKIYDPNI